MGPGRAGGNRARRRAVRPVLRRLFRQLGRRRGRLRHPHARALRSAPEVRPLPRTLPPVRHRRGLPRTIRLGFARRPLGRVFGVAVARPPRQRRTSDRIRDLAGNRGRDRGRRRSGRCRCRIESAPPAMVVGRRQRTDPYRTGPGQVEAGLRLHPGAAPELCVRVVEERGPARFTDLSAGHRRPARACRQRADRRSPLRVGAARHFPAARRAGTTDAGPHAEAQ